MTERLPQPAPEPIGEIIPGTPPIPINLWIVPPTPAAATMSADMAHRLVFNYTHRRGLVLDFTDGPQLAAAAALAHRRCRRLPPLLRTSDGGHGLSPDPQADTARADTVRAETVLSDAVRAGSAGSLAVLAWPVPGIAPDLLFIHAAGHVRDGGCIAVVVSNGDIVFELANLVEAAHACRLTYLQHVVAAPDPTKATESDGTQYHGSTHDNTKSSPEDGRRGNVRDGGHGGEGVSTAPSTSKGASPLLRLSDFRHLRIHTDILLFTRPKGWSDLAL